MSESVSPMFSSRSFIVSGLTLRSLIHFEFILVYGVRKCSSFILLQFVDQFSQHHLLKRLSFLHCIFLPPLSKIRCPQVRGQKEEQTRTGAEVSMIIRAFLSWSGYKTATQTSTFQRGRGKKSSKAKLGCALKHLSSPLLKDFPRIHPKSIVLRIFHSHNCVLWPIYLQES